MTTSGLPNRRESLRFKFLYDGKFSCYGTVGFHPDTGAPAEVFLQVGKAGATLEAMSRDAAIAASLALQAGVPLDTLRGAMTRIEAHAPTSPLAILLDMLDTELKRQAAAAEASAAAQAAEHIVTNQPEGEGNGEGEGMDGSDGGQLEPLYGGGTRDPIGRGDADGIRPQAPDIQRRGEPEAPADGP